MTSSVKKIDDYYQEALASIPNDHPHREEITKLLVDQVNDDLYDATHTISNQ